MLCINTSICWQEEEDFDVGPLGFLDKNGESETLPPLSRESGWSKKMTLSSHLSFSKWGELFLSTHVLPPTPQPITCIHKHTQTRTNTHKHRHIPLEACIVCWEINQNHVKSYGTIYRDPQLCVSKCQGQQEIGYVS